MITNIGATLPSTLTAVTLTSAIFSPVAKCEKILSEEKIHLVDNKNQHHDKQPNTSSDNAQLQNDKVNNTVTSENNDIPDQAMLEFLVQFANTDDETFELIIHHGKDDWEKNRTTQNTSEPKE